MGDCLIGYTGFVGGNLMRSHRFDHLFNSKNFTEMTGKMFETVVCSGLPAEKWKINQRPEEDLRNINELMSVLETVSCKQFILISTVDVYPDGNGYDESYDCQTRENHAYGRHRLMFEKFIRSKFPSALILRLPALFGPGLKKNVIFDLINNNCLEMINPESRFQYYDLRDLWQDIGTMLKTEIKLVNLVTDPIMTSEILDNFFKSKQVGEKKSKTASYDLKSMHANIYGHAGNYIKSKQTIMEKLATYLKEVGA